MIVERGNFIGHLVPASFFLGFGAFFLLLTLKRCRELQCKASKDGPSSVASFVDTHVPENPRVLRRSGVVLMICTTMGFILEAGGGLKDGKGFFYELAHEVMYGTAFFVGMACHLEADGRLCPNSHRYALSFAFLMQYLLWYEHALMLVEDPLANRVHMIQAQINLIASLVFGYSAHAPRSMFAYGERVRLLHSMVVIACYQLRKRKWSQTLYNSSRSRVLKNRASILVTFVTAPSQSPVGRS